MRDHVISGLVKRRAALAGEIIHLRKEVDARAAALRSLDNTIRLFDPSYRPERIPLKTFHPKRPTYATRGELSRVLLDVLRESKEPMTTWQLTETILARKGQSTEDEHVIAVMLKRVSLAMHGQRKKGAVTAEGWGQDVVWSLSSEGPTAKAVDRTGV